MALFSYGGGFVEYITEYSIAALILQIFLIVIFCIRKKYPCSANRCFLTLLCISIAATALNILSFYSIKNVQTMPLWLNYVINIAYLMAYNTSGVAFYVYSTMIFANIRRDPLIWPICITGGLLYLFVLLPTPITGAVINFDGGTYNHGPLFILLYIYSFIIMAIIFFRMSKHKNKINRSLRITLQLFVICTIAAVIIQAVFPMLVIQDLVGSIFLMMIYMSLQNPDDYMDKITGCFNRNAFYETVERLIEGKTQFSLVVFDLDGFQQITHILGVKAGNETIDAISSYFMDCFGGYCVYHLYGCRYAVIIDKKSAFTLDEAVSVIREYFSHPYKVDGNVDVLLVPLICVINYPEFEISSDDIDAAVDYSFKKLEGNSELNYIVATSESLNEKLRENKVLSCIKLAVRNHSFEVYYQPILSVKDRCFLSAEALVRLHDDELGFISPDEFIPLAEQNGMIIEIGEQVFREVCRFIRESGVCADNGGRRAVEYIEVNLSMVQCMQEDLAPRLMSIMDEYGVAPENINFEITESARYINESALRKNMLSLIDAGSSFSMDDYGTGFSTAEYLITLPMKIIKIDKSILWSAMKDNEAFTVLNHTVQMLKDLRKEIVVEGIENEEMEKVLTDMGCDFLQGYMYSKPIPGNDFLKFIS